MNLRKQTSFCYTLRLQLLTGSNFSDFANLFTFRVLILAIFGFQPQNTLTANSLVDYL